MFSWPNQLPTLGANHVGVSTSGEPVVLCVYDGFTCPEGRLKPKASTDLNLWHTIQLSRSPVIPTSPSTRAQMSARVGGPQE